MNKKGLLWYTDEKNRIANNKKIQMEFQVLINMDSIVLIEMELEQLDKFSNKLQTLNTGRQLIVSSIYYKFIHYCMMNNIFIKNILFDEELDVRTKEYIKDLITEINRFDLNDKIKKELYKSFINELMNLDYNKCIYISEFVIESPNKKEIILSNKGISFQEIDLEFLSELLYYGFH